MNIGFKSISLIVITMLSPYVFAAAELAPGVLDAKWLVENCRSVPQDSSVPKGIGSAAQAGACVGYLGALAEIAPIMNRVVPANAQVCTQGQISPKALAQIVLEYIKKKPDVAADPRLVVSLAALSEKYPCR